MSDEVPLIGSLVLIGACVAVVVFATSTYRKSSALAAAAILANPGDPLELICGIRFGLFNATWPAGRCRLTDDGVAFSGFGLAKQAGWHDVKAVELVRPLNQIGWGVRFLIPTMQPETTTVWLGSRLLAERLLESCEVRHVPVQTKARVVL